MTAVCHTNLSGLRFFSAKRFDTRLIFRKIRYYMVKTGKRGSGAAESCLRPPDFTDLGDGLFIGIVERDFFSGFQDLFNDRLELG